MKFSPDRPYSDPEKAARRLLEIANAVEAVLDGRIPIEKINAPFLFRERATPADLPHRKRMRPSHNSYRTGFSSPLSSRARSAPTCSGRRATWALRAWCRSGPIAPIARADRRTEPRSRTASIRPIGGCRIGSRCAQNSNEPVRVLPSHESRHSGIAALGHERSFQRQVATHFFEATARAAFTLACAQCRGCRPRMRSKPCFMAANRSSILGSCSVSVKM